jgi:PPK2 family polyphosphate:nucleotide phosphotransferase
MADKKISRRDVPEALRVAAHTRFRLRDADADRTLGWERDQVDAATAENLQRLGELQYKMYADARFAMLVVIQGIDGGGKDSTIRRVMSTFNPQGFTVTAFKAPSAEELRHDYLWRIHNHVPPRGEVAVFNRSHYEDVLVVRVDNLVPEAVWSQRYEQINRFELNLHECATRIVKIFLHISRDEQKRRLEERLAVRSKQWKFSTEDLAKRAQWDEYRQAFEAAITRCTSMHAPWFVVPANRKWFRDFAVSQILLQQFEQLPLRWPRPHYDAKSIRID